MRTVTIAGGNLFRLAAELLGDATQWLRIAQANGLSDPAVSGLATLRIPDPDPNAGGGIARQ
jgi:nucleoid-associated protein YgaU